MRSVGMDENEGRHLDMFRSWLLERAAKDVPEAFMAAWTEVHSQVVYSGWVELLCPAWRAWVAEQVDGKDEDVRDHTEAGE